MLKLHRGVTAEHVNGEIERRIFARYPLTKQLNLTRLGEAAAVAEMGAFIDALRAKGKALKALQPIPADFSDDRHWQ